MTKSELYSELSKHSQHELIHYYKSYSILSPAKLQTLTKDKIISLIIQYLFIQ